MLGDVSGKSTSVSIKEDNGDNEPGNLVDTLANPGTLTSNVFNTFTAQPVITLAASTTYWLTVNEGISSDRVFVSSKSQDDEAGETGWSIGDGSLYRTSEMDPWSDSTSSLLITIRGTISTDATLSGLTLEGADGGEAITLSPAFDAETETYTAAVVNRIDAVKLTATKNDDNAMVVITNDDDDRLARGGGAGPQRRVQHTDRDGYGAGRHHHANLHGHRGTVGSPRKSSYPATGA